MQRAINPSIKTKPRKNTRGEIINPTPEDVKQYNKKYKTIKSISLPRGKKSIPLPKRKIMPAKRKKQILIPLD